jgi:LmbE family N-acetylglucosaminyl deacetylase
MLTATSSLMLNTLLRMYSIPVSPLNSMDRPQKVVVLAPHIDDETIGCGGVLYKHVQQGDDVTVIFLTDGSRSARPSPNLVAQREDESVVAVQQILGVKNLIYWRFVDRDLNKTSEAHAKISATLAELQPDILYITSPWDIHPDHIAAAEYVRSAAMCVQKSIRIYETFCPLTPLLLNYSVDITDAYSAKRAALDVFKSQVVPFQSILLLNKAHAAATHQPNICAVETFIDVKPHQYSQVLDMLAYTQYRPRVVTHVRNLVRGYVTNLFRAKRVSSNRQVLA